MLKRLLFQYLNYAEANRKEWEIKGKEVVQEYIDKYGKNKPKADESTKEDDDVLIEDESEKSTSIQEREKAPAVEEAPAG